MTQQLGDGERLREQLIMKMCSKLRCSQTACDCHAQRLAEFSVDFSDPAPWDCLDLEAPEAAFITAPQLEVAVRPDPAHVS